MPRRISPTFWPLWSPLHKTLREKSAWLLVNGSKLVLGDDGNENGVWRICTNDLLRLCLL
ncbi:Protein of unknown function [Pyronema omphalodes CBS 100304]|uniref:Uncharacterized protein n=1 Tax=Pyronema omphalodes (strain CBS 100304) TaxID=1076935 RepID=U4KVH3_PYROM|nr:Protein of unknown function [Pyronema omphalodes CBS 100304]